MRFSHVLIATGLVFGASPGQTATQSQTRPRAPEVRAADEVLRRQVGKWATTVTVYDARGGEEKVYKSVSTATLGCGGRCLIWDLASEMAPGQPYHGHGIEVYDPVAEQYVGTWTDATASGFTTSKYTYNRAKNTFAGTFESTNSSGRATTLRMTGDFTKPNERVMTMSTEGGEGVVGPVIRCAMVRQ